jgi:pilus assembly protein CpaB
LRFSFLRRTWPYLLAVAVGLAVAAFSFGALNRSAVSQDKVRIPVAARDLPPYTILQPQDIAWGGFPADLPGAVKVSADAVGKVLTKAVSKDYPFREGDLKNPEEMDVQLVSVNIDASRLGGTRPGDLVDVYWVQPADKGAWAPGAGAVLLARDARVVGILDKGGQPVEPSQSVVAAAVPAVKTPAIAVLAVRPEEARIVVSGSASGNTCVALVKKFKTGGVPVGADAGGQVSSPPQAAPKPAGAGR